MRLVLAEIDRRTAAFDRLPLYEFMRDQRVDPRRRIAFVPALSHFVMSFADLYNHVLRVEPANDRMQELVNAHADEDGGHWKWFLADLARLGFDASQPVSETLRAVWQPATTGTRMLTYEMCRLGLRASSLQKLVLVHCIEATGRVSLRAVAPIADALTAHGTRGLVYFGSHHVETESDHTLEDASVHDWVADAVLDDCARREALRVVDEAFDAFEAFAHDLHRFALASPEL